ncbi:unnamed protein product [Brassicogethes aeneus]|uniref:Protein AAR2 homolog n=1 Tax=Brassicogethes aeneus TaxID=1431903 RepID=A0A9P0BAW1_BRAAE|nr:unnamed protein product [Brassicogethes aeneus]
MNQETAKKLVQEGGLFIFLNVPEGTEFGIDMKSWNTGEKFRGVKMIPPGVHYIFYSATSNTGDIAPRTGFFHNFRKSEILVKKWDSQLEDISQEEVSQEEIVRLKDNIKALDGFLGPYPFDILDKWNNLCGNINDDLIKILTPLSGKVRSALELQSCSNADRPKGVKKNPNDAETSSGSSPKKSRLSNDTEHNFLPDLKPIEGTELRLTEFPKKNYPDGATPSEITKHSLDSTYVLDMMVSKLSDPVNIIGELEFCYICFLVGHSLEAFEHWKKLFSLFCSCESGIKKYRKLYDLFFSDISIQIKEIPEEFLADIVANKNFVYVKLKNLFNVIKSSDLDGQLKMKVERFQKELTDTYYWDFQHLESDEEDEAPVIVEI